MMNRHRQNLQGQDGGQGNREGQLGNMSPRGSQNSGKSKKPKRDKNSVSKQEICIGKNSREQNYIEHDPHHIHPEKSRFSEPNRNGISDGE